MLIQHIIAPGASMLGALVCLMRYMSQGKKIGSLTKELMEIVVVGFFGHILWLLIPLCSNIDCHVPQNVIGTLSDHQILYAVFFLLGFFHDDVIKIIGGKKKALSSTIKKKIQDKLEGTK